MIYAQLGSFVFVPAFGCEVDRVTYAKDFSRVNWAKVPDVVGSAQGQGIEIEIGEKQGYKVAKPDEVRKAALAERLKPVEGLWIHPADMSYLEAVGGYEKARPAKATEVNSAIINRGRK